MGHWFESSPVHKIYYMKRVIEYYEIKSDHVLAIPEFVSKENVEFKNIEDLDKYIRSKKDLSGSKYKKKSSFGFDYISNQGAIKIKKYIEPKFKKI